jgi:RNA polymerase sigma-70 factor (ECF subfamily)
MDEDFASWYRGLYPTVVATLSAATREPAVSEEAAQEAFARALERWDKVHRMRSPDGWVYTVALNLARRNLRNRRRLSGPVELDSERWLQQGPVARDPDLLRALTGLAERERLAVCLRYLADLKERDVARVMGLRPGTVARTLHDARLKLATALTEHPPDEEEEDHAC